MATAGTICNRKEPRFRICEGQVLGCVTGITGSSTDQVVPGTVVDISSSGLRILSDGSFEVGMSIETELNSELAPVTYHGTVRRVEPWVGGKSILGCELDRSISAAVLENLAAAGIVNRRADDRVTWDKPASISWELEPGSTPIEIRDYSPGGMRIFSHRQIPPDVRLRVRLVSDSGQEMEVPTTAVWNTNSEHGCHTGLAFTTRGGPTQIANLHMGIDRKSYSDAVNQPVIRPSLMVAAAITLMVVAAVEFMPMAVTF